MNDEATTSGSEKPPAARPTAAPPAPAGDEPALFDKAMLQTATVLLVDDEALITDSLRHFFQLELEIESVVTFNAPVEALAWASTNRVDMVITDFMMPEIDGIRLLAEIKRRHPEATRIMLTGYADKANAIRAINEVGLFQYVEKPWDSDRFATIVRAGLEHMALQRTLRELIGRLNVEHGEREHLRRALIRAFA